MKTVALANKGDFPSINFVTFCNMKMPQTHIVVVYPTIKHAYFWLNLYWVSYCWQSAIIQKVLAGNNLSLHHLIISSSLQLFIHIFGL